MPAILLCGSEGEQFLYENTLSVKGADDKRRGSVELGLGQQMFRQFATPVDDIWVHVRFDVELRSGITTIVGRDTVVVSRGTTQLAKLTCTEAGSSTPFVTMRFDVGGVAGPSFPHAPGDFVNYDIRVVVSGGTVTGYLYRDEVLRHVQTVVGVPTPWQSADRVLIQPHVQNTASNGRIWVQDVIITDGIPTVGMELATLVPAALGSYDEFSNDYTAIDDFGYNQSSTITSVTPGDRESWFYADPEFDLGDKVIYGLAMVTVAQTDLAGVVDDFNTFVRIAATNYDAPRMNANNVAPNAYVTVLQTNPATAQPWKQVDLVGLEAGIRSQSL